MSRSIRRSFCAGVAGILLAVTPFTLAASPGAQGPASRAKKFDTALQKVGTSGLQTVPVIVKADPAARTAVRKALKDLGFKVKREHGGISAFTFDAPVGMLERIAAIPGVLGVSMDAEIGGDLLGIVATVPATSGTLLRDTLGLTNVSVTGKGVTVALIDSGIAPSLDFSVRIKAFYDFTRGGIATAPYDDNGHGTHVAGLIGGTGLLSLGQYRGVAPNVSFVGLKVLTGAGGGSTSNLIAAVEFATANKAKLGIDIINLSLGHPPYEPAALDPLVQAVQAASKAGILVVSSAGNHGINKATGLPGFGGISSPANAPSSLTVGSERVEGTKRRSDDTVGAWSSRGPSWYDGYVKPDIIAPGHKMVAPAAPLSTLVLSNPTLLLSGSRYLTLTGTSMSAGVVSGLAALVIEANRTAFPGGRALTPNAIKTIFQYTAFAMHDAQGQPVSRLIQGAGMINGVGAIKLAKAINPSATTGAARLTGWVEPSDWLDERLSWAQNIIWGDNVIWGDNLLWGDNVIWGDNIVWGENLVWGENIVWGENLIWGENIVWGENLIWGENVVWGENLIWGENIVWGENLVWGENFLDDSNAPVVPSEPEPAPTDAEIAAYAAETF